MSKLSNAALLAVRTGVGGALIAHGAQKLFGAFGGGGIDGTAKAFESMGFPDARRNAKLAGLGETFGGASLLLGLGTGVGGASAAGTMIVASAIHAPNGFFATKGGLEYPALLGLVASAIALGGPGDASVDAKTKHALNRPWMRVAALVGSAGAAAYTVRSRRSA